jgi:hypothetical protein
MAWVTNCDLGGGLMAEVTIQVSRMSEMAERGVISVFCGEATAEVQAALIKQTSAGND